LGAAEIVRRCALFTTWCPPRRLHDNAWSETNIAKESGASEFDRTSPDEIAKALEERANALGLKISLSIID